MAVADTIATREFPSTKFMAYWDPNYEILPASAYTNGSFSKQWYAHPKGVTADYPYEFCCERIYTYEDEETSIEKVWEPFQVANIGLWAHYGQNASFYTLTLDNQQDTVLYNDRNSDTKKELHCSGCTTSYIKLTRGTLKQEVLAIDNLSINDVKFIENGVLNSSEQEVTLTQQGWTIKVQVVKDSEGIKLNINSGEITPENDSSNGFSNDIARIPITVNNATDGITKTVIWTVTALWNKKVLHHYKLFLSPGSFTNYQYISVTYDSNGNVSSSKKTNDTNTDSGVTCTVFQDDENNSWHSIKDYSYYIQISATKGGEVKTLGPYSGASANWSQSDLQSALQTTTKYTSDSTEGGAGGASLLVSLYVNDPNYSTGTTLSINPSYYLVDQQDFSVMYYIIKVIQGATGAKGDTGATGATGESGSSGTTVSITDGGTYYNLCVGGKCYDIAKAT